MIISFSETANLVGHMVALELVAESEEMCGGADAIVGWALARSAHERDLAALGAFVDVLSWQTASYIENLFGWRAA